MTEEFDEDVVFEVCITAAACFLLKLTDALSYLSSSDAGFPIH